MIVALKDVSHIHKNNMNVRNEKEILRDLKDCKSVFYSIMM